MPTLKTIPWYEHSQYKLENEDELRNYIDSNTSDPWEGTQFEGYVHLGAKQKGIYGEMFTEGMCKKSGLTVEKAFSSTAGHDRVINGIRTEIKFSLAQKGKNNSIIDNQFIMNHVSEKKDWQRLIFIGINFNQSPIIIWFSKEDFQSHLESEDKCFSRQQGGQNGGNDDWICSAKNLQTLFEKPFVKHGFSQW